MDMELCLSIETVVIQLLRAIKMAHNQSGQSELRVIANDYVVSPYQVTDGK